MSQKMVSLHEPLIAGDKSGCLHRHRSRLLMIATFILILSVFILVQCIHPVILCCQNTVTISDPVGTEDEWVSRYAEDGTVEYMDENGIMRIRYKHTKRQLPHCIIIGVRKGGTRALLEFLNLHPQIQAEKREMHFFDHEENYSNGLDWYRKHMPYSFPDQITIEKTPAYFTEELVPERVFRMNKTIQLVVILRDPVERAISDYTQIHSNKILKGHFHESFESMAMDPETGEVNKSYKALRRSIYHRHMERWLRFFPLTQFHFVSGENLVENPVQELRKVEDFLGIEHRLTEDKFFYNSTRGFYCMHLQHKEKCLAPSKGRQHPEISTRVIRKLRRFFQPHNQQFYNLVGINFNWPEE